MLWAALIRVDFNFSGSHRPQLRELPTAVWRQSSSSGHQQNVRCRIVGGWSRWTQNEGCFKGNDEIWQEWQPALIGTAWSWWMLVLKRQSGPWHPTAFQPCSTFAASHRPVPNNSSNFEHLWIEAKALKELESSQKAYYQEARLEEWDKTLVISCHIWIYKVTSLAEAYLEESDQHLAQSFCGCLVSVCRCKSSEMPAKTPRTLQVSVCLLDSITLADAILCNLMHLL